MLIDVGPKVFGVIPVPTGIPLARTTFPILGTDEDINLSPLLPHLHRDLTKVVIGPGFEGAGALFLRPLQ
jgi:hypothetical protein